MGVDFILELILFLFKGSWFCGLEFVGIGMFFVVLVFWLFIFLKGDGLRFLFSGFLWLMMV